MGMLFNIKKCNVISITNATKARSTISTPWIMSLPTRINVKNDAVSVDVGLSAWRITVIVLTKVRSTPNKCKRARVCRFARAPKGQQHVAVDTSPDQVLSYAEPVTKMNTRRLHSQQEFSSGSTRKDYVRQKLMKELQQLKKTCDRHSCATNSDPLLTRLTDYRSSYLRRPTTF